jgi:spore coat polysaccharide biosynthesis predicted glycosyltransferase SpsG
MNRDPILFRVDATPRTGYENLSRCLTFAAALQRRRRTAYFLSRLEPASLGLNIKRAGNEWLEADGLAGSDDDLKETLQEIRRLKPAAVVVDSPLVDEAYLSAVRDTGVLLVNFDHLGAVHFPSDLLINPLLGPDKEVYEYRPSTQILMGPRYALVRSEVRRCRASRSQEPPLLPPPNGKSTQGQYRVMISLGEDDPQEQALNLAKLLLNVPRIGKVDVVVRPHYPHLEKLQALAEANAERLELAQEPAEVTARIIRCHFAITSGNGWSLELAAVGVPQLLIVQSEAFWPTAQRLEEEGCATCLGGHENVSAATIRTAIQNLLADPSERQAMSRCGRQLIDARGPDRLVTGLEVMLHPAGLNTFRIAA